MKLLEKANENKSAILLWLLNAIILRVLWFYSEFFYLDTPTRMVLVERPLSSIFFHPDVETATLSFVPQVIANRIFGDSVNVLYLAQFIIFLFAIVVLYLLMTILLDSKIIRILCISFIYTNSTFAENIFTNGKAETTVLFSFLLFCFFLYLILFQENKNNILKILNYILFETSIIFTLFSKMTGIVIIIPIAILLLYLVFFIKNKELNRKILIISFIVITNLLLWYWYNKIYRIPSTYTSYSITIQTILSNFMIYLKYNFDLYIFGFISLLYIIKEIYNKKNVYNTSYFLAINLMGWSYIAGMCLWRWSCSYYLFPVSALFTISIVPFIRSVKSKGKSIMILVLVIIGLYGIRTNYLIATSQIDVGKSYSDSIHDLVEINDEGGRILIATSYFFEEPIVQTNLLINNIYNKNMKIYGVYQNLLNIDLHNFSNTLGLYGYTMEQYDEISKELNPRAGDYIIVYENERNFYGNVRAINPSYVNRNIDDLLEQYDLQLISQNQIDRKYIGLDKNRLIIKNNYAGYKIFKVNKKRYSMKGVYDDGWTEKYFEILDYTRGEGLQLTVNDIGSIINGYYDNEISIMVNGTLVESINVKGENDLIVLDSILQDYSENINIGFSVTNTFNPKTLGFSNDDRNLGLNIVINYDE